jgi:hypothetical protein
MNEYRLCGDCVHYIQVRRDVLIPAFVARKRVTGETSREILDRFMDGVHARHLAGLPILSPTTVSRLAGRFAALMAQVNPADPA